MSDVPVWPRLSPAEARRIDQICDSFEAAWKAGPRPLPEDYMPAAGEPERAELLRQLLLLDWDFRQRAGDRPVVGDYLARFPGDEALIDAVGREMSVHADDTPLPAGLDDLVPEAAVSGSARYELLQEVGHGGAGVVFRGRDRLMGRELAVKVLRDAHRRSPEIYRRFIDEARVGSRLQHPAIVPVYELGWFDDRRPYFTMKLVEGRTLAVLLKERANPAQDWPRLLGVFEQVCQAMAYAHAQGVVHRDLKPANIMVGAFGEVQVMDWGFAKVLGPEASIREAAPAAPAASEPAPASASQSGVMMGTPAYMPPEQARGEAGLIGPQADVFALGAILCEILAGAPPYVGGLREICLMAAEGDLADASKRLDTCGADAALRELAKRCLAADRTARPADAGVLARDLAAYLASAQEQVRQAQLGQAAAEARAKEARAKAEAERRARRLILGLAAALLVGTGVAVWQAMAAASAKHDAQAAAAAETKAKETANAKEAETRAVLDFVESKIFAAARPKSRTGGLGSDVSLRAAIEAAEPSVEVDFKDQPLVEARLRVMLGDSYWQLGDGKAAAPQYEQARAIYARILGPDDSDTLKCVNWLGVSYLMQGRTQDGVKLLEELLPHSRARFGPNDVQTLAVMNNLGQGYFELEQYEKSIEIEQECLEIKKAQYGPDDARTLVTMTNLANNYHKLKQYNEALQLRLKTFELQKAKLGPKEYDTLMSEHNIGANYRMMERYADALRFDEETLALRRETLTQDHPDTLISMWSVGKDLILLDRSADGVPILDDCLRRAVGKYVHGNFRDVADVRLHYFEKSKDAAGCRTTAELWETQKRTDALSLYEAACCRAVTAKVLRATDPSPASAMEAEAEADQAMAWLEKAISKGYKKWDALSKDPDLDALRDRADFRKLLAALNPEN